MAFSNLYYKRTAATAKACYVCYKPSTTVLATINTTDFLYTCPAHLTDSNFATALGESNDPGVSAEEIAKVKEEWEQRQKIKLEKEKAKEKEKNEKEAGEKEKDADKKTSKIPGTHSPDPPTPPSTSAATHQRYSLQRDYFAMRLSEHRKRRQAARAKELAPRLPGAPRGALTETF